MKLVDLVGKSTGRGAFAGQVVLVDFWLRVVRAVRSMPSCRR